MAGHKGARYYDIFLKYRFWLESTDGRDIVGSGRFELLEAIQSEGSVSAAARKLGISYRSAWGNLKKAEQMLGFSLTKRIRGGAKGGVTVLSDEGANLISAYRNLLTEMDLSIHQIARKFFHDINKE